MDQSEFREVLRLMNWTPCLFSILPFCLLLIPPSSFLSSPVCLLLIPPSSFLSISSSFVFSSLSASHLLCLVFHLFHFTSVHSTLSSLLVYSSFTLSSLSLSHILLCPSSFPYLPSHFTFPLISSPPRGLCPVSRYFHLTCITHTAPLCCVCMRQSMRVCHHVSLKVSENVCVSISPTVCV